MARGLPTLTPTTTPSTGPGGVLSVWSTPLGSETATTTRVRRSPAKQQTFPDYINFLSRITNSQNKTTTSITFKVKLKAVVAQHTKPCNLRGRRLTAAMFWHDHSNFPFLGNTQNSKQQIAFRKSAINL